MAETTKTFLYFVSVAIVSVIATLAADWAIGYLTPTNQDRDGLLFPSRSETVYETVEFRFKASINKFGIRDHDDIDRSKSLRYRIFTIGDSFTFGWGVTLDETWPKVLERNLHARGLNVEIFNLGKPGAGPADYAHTAEKATPLFKPDFVIVAVLQGDDLAQLKSIPVENRGQPKVEHDIQKTWDPKTVLFQVVHRIIQICYNWRTRCVKK